MKDGKVLLLRRSNKVGTHQGKWAGVSGYLEDGEEPLQRAKTEIQEELGLSLDQIEPVRIGETLRALDTQTDRVWIVHPFLFETSAATIKLDWESEEFKWIDPNNLHLYDTVPKLAETFDRVRCNLQATPGSLATVFVSVDGLARDRVRGASALGRQALELLSVTADTSQAAGIEELFCDLLIIASRLRFAQPGMAILKNLVGLLLYQVNLKRHISFSIVEFKNLIHSLVKEVSERSKNSSEDASRNAASILPEDGAVLTHSYSSTALRALELGMKSGKKFQVYSTESYPGLEGKELAKALVALGVSVRLVTDAAVGKLIQDVDLVLVGADSVMKDGSLLHKIGTRPIAAAANERNIPVYCVCETTKFSAADLLGEPAQYSEELFDLTPANFISKFITEAGTMEPSDVEDRIRVMLNEMYP
jgi:translation initiation factor 2B subunit (eIF-2B alpha/beta/delta family)/8-oxo-dGTP pyrophosphatase MutT (NUDIX family)